MKYANFRTNNQFCLLYRSLSFSKSQNLSSKNEFDLLFHMELISSVEIRENHYNNLILGRCSEIILINTVLELEFISDDNSKIKFFMKPDSSSFDPRLNIGSNTIFSTKLTTNDIEKLYKVKKGQRVFLRWNLRGYGSVNINNVNHIIFINESNFTESKNMLPHLNSHDFDSEILKITNLSKEFIVNFPIQMQINTNSTFSAELNSLIDELKICISNLEEAVNIFRNSNSIYDYKLVMLYIKSALDSIRKYNFKKQIGKELLIKPGIIGNVDPSGGDIAAEEVIDDFFRIMDHIYQIVSKPGHKITRKPHSLKFNMSPDRAETIFCLTVSLSSAKYLFEKINQISDQT